MIDPLFFYTVGMIDGRVKRKKYSARFNWTELRQKMYNEGYEDGKENKGDRYMDVNDSE